MSSGDPLGIILLMVVVLCTLYIGPGVSAL